MSDAIRTRRDSPRCYSCVMRHFCVPEGLTARDISKLKRVISVAHRMRCGEALFRTGDAFNAFFAVRSDSLKTVAIRDGGRKQITGLVLAADPLGLAGIGEGQHTRDAIALEDSSMLAASAAPAVTGASLVRAALASARDDSSGNRHIWLFVHIT
jgi:CRP/FNR family transcriptional regulator, anaerobic regulatory protein